MFIVTRLYKYLHEKKTKQLQDTFDVALQNALDIRDHSNRTLLEEQIKRNAIDREFELAEFEKERMGFRMQLKEKDLALDSLKKSHAEKVESLKKRFEDQDKERVKSFNALRTTLDNVLAKVSDLKSYWEGSVTFTTDAVQRISSKVESRKFLLMEVIKRVEQLHREGKDLEAFEKELFNHHAKILQEAPYLEEFFLTIEEVEYKLSHEDVMV